MSGARVTQTTDLHLAACWYAAGLALLEVSAVEDPRRCVFRFADPDAREAALTSAFFADHHLQAVLDARKRLARALNIAKHADSRRCTDGELRARLSDQQRRTYERVRLFAGKR